MMQMKRKIKTKDEEKNLTLVEHLSELRRRVIFVIIVFIGATLVSYNFSEPIIRSIIEMAPEMKLVFISPSELFMANLKIAILMGLVIASPVILTNLWLFVSPALEKGQKRAIIVALSIGGVFFVLGAYFAFRIVLPTILQFFMGFKIPEIEEMISFNSYLTLVVNTMLSFGIVFEMPSIMMILTKLGLIKVAFMKRYRKYVILVIFVVGALLTPPDVISQVMIAVPMLVLFETGLLLSSMIERKKKKLKAQNEGL